MPDETFNIAPEASVMLVAIRSWPLVVVLPDAPMAMVASELFDEPPRFPPRELVPFRFTVPTPLEAPTTFPVTTPLVRVRADPLAKETPFIAESIFWSLAVRVLLAATITELREFAPVPRLPCKVKS